MLANYTKFMPSTAYDIMTLTHLCLDKSGVKNSECHHDPDHAKGTTMSSSSGVTTTPTGTAVTSKPNGGGAEKGGISKGVVGLVVLVGVGLTFGGF
jgi:hypothetical protein